MPYKSESIKIDHTKHDRRIKLSIENKEDIKYLYYRENYSLRELARRFNVDKRTIQFIIDPLKLEENIKRREEKGGWKQYYDKDKNNSYIKKHRKYKQDLHTVGII